MATEDPSKPVSDWTGDTLADRIHKCRMMLRLHGYITQAESDRVKVKQLKRGMIPADAIMVMPEPPPGPAPKARRRKGANDG
jgi:hypothetical protein